MSVFDPISGRERTAASSKISRRPHHYFFAHKALPQNFFREPDMILAALDAPSGSLWLAGAWNEIGRKMSAAGEGPSLPPTGLAATFCEIAGGRWPLITFPTPIAMVEVSFALMLREKTPGSAYRYLVLEQLEESTPDQPIGVLCEWFADGSRRNYETVVASNKDAFLFAVSKQLEMEARRKAAGVATAAALPWNPNLGKKYNEFERGEDYRLQNCLFAFEVIPQGTAHSLAAWVTEIENGRTAALQESLWREAGQRCGQRGKPQNQSAAGLKMEIVTVRQEKGIFITMPPPTGAHEPYFLFLPASGAKPDRNRKGLSQSVYTFEMPHGGLRDAFYLCHLTAEGTHGVVTLLPGAARENCLATLERIEAGENLLESGAGGNLMGQLMLYAKISSTGKEKPVS